MVCPTHPPQGQAKPLILVTVDFFQLSRDLRNFVAVNCALPPPPPPVENDGETVDICGH